MNVITGLGSEAGSPISTHDDIDKISFTGSVPTAQKIMAGAALGPRAISLELGGKSPLIVFEDAEVNSAVDWILTGILWGSGQVCSATSRVLVHKDLREKLLARLLERLQAVKIGRSLDEDMKNHEGPTMGPVVSRGQYEKILSQYIAHGIHTEKLSVFFGGDEAQAALSAKFGDGYFVHPIVFVDVPTTSKLWNEEIFGPVLCIRVSKHHHHHLFIPLCN
jgi:betaine-aldehyde dehydrogenase